MKKTEAPVAATPRAVKRLLIVESPTKARTIGRFLGNKINVLASTGHIRDLPERSLGVDIANDFRPEYVLTANGKKVMKGLRIAAAEADEIYLATDPDREGEAIAWHLQNVLQDASKAPFYRVTFHEITQNAIQHAFANPGSLALNLIDAQQARRVLDRIVGYQVSPLLWRSIKKGTSAGRVQSVALRLIAEREREILAFIPEEYWNLDAMFAIDAHGAKLKTRLSRLNGKKAVVGSTAEATALAAAIESTDVTHKVNSITDNPRRQNAPPPFITSTLQQAAGGLLKFSTTQTMRIAQELYEGVELGQGGAVGLITYMRTDSVSISKDAQAQAADYITTAYGKEYLPEKPNVFRSRKSAQEAHEAIRPTDVSRTPEALANSLTPPQMKLYRLIWNRFVASQMASARQIDHVIEIESAGGALAALVWPPVETGKPGTACTFRAAARETVFPGYLRVYSTRDLGEEDEMDSSAGTLPHLTVGQACNLLELLREQCFTTPPGRYSEASLVKALEQNGVGRPSTYAATVNTILTRDYVGKEKSLLFPTELGFSVNDFLVQQMPELFDIGFTAEMEEALDHIEEGKLNWTEMLQDFYKKFQGWLGAHGATGLLPGASGIPGLDYQKLLETAFPEGFAYKTPENSRFNDNKFVDSLKKQLGNGKVLSPRQFQALLALLANYRGEHPHIATLVEESGLTGQLPVPSDSDAARKESTAEPLSPETRELLTKLQKVTWEPAVKRGKRTYDDGKFFRSLQRQAKESDSLSVPQCNALQKLGEKYGVVSKAEISPANTSEAGDSEADGNGNDEMSGRIGELLKLSEHITQWREPSGKGRFKFDDKEFVASLQKQFLVKRTLSDKQVNALGKVLGKYTEQIPNFAEKAQQLVDMLPAAVPPQPIEEMCPNCGAPLVKRQTRGRAFIGCSTFPKCRYTRG